MTSTHIHAPGCSSCECLPQPFTFQATADNWDTCQVCLADWYSSICQHAAQCNNWDASDKRHASIQIPYNQIENMVWKIHCNAIVWSSYPCGGRLPNIMLKGPGSSQAGRKDLGDSCNTCHHRLNDALRCSSCHGQLILHCNGRGCEHSHILTHTVQTIKLVLPCQPTSAFPAWFLLDFAKQMGQQAKQLAAVQTKGLCMARDKA